jgi:hypothetical protein
MPNALVNGQRDQPAGRFRELEFRKMVVLDTREGLNYFEGIVNVFQFPPKLTMPIVLMLRQKIVKIH